MPSVDVVLVVVVVQLVSTEEDALVGAAGVETVEVVLFVALTTINEVWTTAGVELELINGGKEVYTDERGVIVVTEPFATVEMVEFWYMGKIGEV